MSWTPKFLREYEADIAKTKKGWTGESCLTASCHGKQGEPKPERPDLITQCPVCGTGIIRPTYSDWLKGKRVGSRGAIRLAKKDIEWAEAAVEDEKKELERKRENVRNARFKLKQAYAEARKWR